MSLTELADRAGVDKGYLSKYERGLVKEPSNHWRHSVTRALGEFLAEKAATK